MKEALDALEQKKFSEFAKKVKQSLEDKYNNNQKVKDYKEQKDSLTKTKEMFSKINLKSEPESEPNSEDPKETAPASEE